MSRSQSQPRSADDRVAEGCHLREQRARLEEIQRDRDARGPGPGTAGLIRGYADLEREAEAEDPDSHADARAEVRIAVSAVVPRRSSDR